MIQCVFTLDYEIYGNGTGALRELVYEPGERLRETFNEAGVKLVNFVEVAELQKIESQHTDPSIELVKAQVKRYFDEGFEIALHLHPQWYNATYDGTRWLLDYSEYNLCTLSRDRISEIVGNALAYLRSVVQRPEFTPLSFRAGNWLFLPSATAASVLWEHGLRVDSSVFKGGLQHAHKLDYRPSLANPEFWRFSDDANKATASGLWIEVPIYAEMVPVWRMATAKRVSLGNTFGGATRRGSRIHRVLDFMRFRYPLKFDFCRMTLDELTSMVDRLIRADKARPDVYRPMVAIGHTKDLTDVATVRDFLSFLRNQEIEVCTFNDIYARLAGDQERIAV